MKCVYCASGYIPHERGDTKEWVHSIMKNGKHIHCVCVDKQAKETKQVEGQRA